MSVVDIFDIEREFAAFMEANGVAPPKDGLRCDGKLHRYSLPDDKHGAKSGAYQVWPEGKSADGHPHGWAMDHRRGGEKENWQFPRDDSGGLSSVPAPSKEERAAAKRRVEGDAKEDAQKKADAARAAAKLYESAEPADPEHAYLTRKHVGVYGDVRQSGDKLLFPWRDIETGEISTLQTIDVNGEKRWAASAAKRGAFMIAGDVTAGPVLITEGAATGLTVYEAAKPDCTVLAAGDAGMLKQAAETARKRWPGRKIIIATDDDFKTHLKTGANPGLDHAREAVKAGLADGFVAPPFERDLNDETDRRTDWNDYVAEYGEDRTAEALRRAIDEAMKPALNEKLEHLLSLRRTIDTSIQLPPLEEIAGLFPRGGLSFLVSKPGVGKSWLVQRISSDLSIGGAILDGYAYSEPKVSLILAGEAGYGILIRRGTSMRWSVDTSKVHVFDAHEAERAGMALELDTEDGRRLIEGLIKEYRPDALFVDSLVAFHASDENKGKEMRPIYSYLNGLAHGENIAVILSHHVTKSKRSERKIRMDMDDVIGSSMLQRYAHAIIAVEWLGDEQDKTRIVSSLKARDKKPKPFTYQLLEDEYGRDIMKVNLDPTADWGARDRILIYIETTYAPGEWFAASVIEENAKASGPFVRKCLKDWVDDGTLIREGTTNRVRYSIRGDSAGAQDIPSRATGGGKSVADRGNLSNTNGLYLLPPVADK